MTLEIKIKTFKARYSLLKTAKLELNFIRIKKKDILIFIFYLDILKIVHNRVMFTMPSSTVSGGDICGGTPTELYNGIRVIDTNLLSLGVIFFKYVYL